MAKNHIHLPPVVNRIKRLLTEDGYIIIFDEAIESGHQIRLTNGAIVNIYCTGTISVQGKNGDNVKYLLGIK